MDIPKNPILFILLTDTPSDPRQMIASSATPVLAGSSSFSSSPSPFICSSTLASFLWIRFPLLKSPSLATPKIKSNTSPKRGSLKRYTPKEPFSTDSFQTKVFFLIDWSTSCQPLRGCQEGQSWFNYRETMAPSRRWWLECIAEVALMGQAIAKV